MKYTGLKIPVPFVAFCSFIAISQASPSALCPGNIATTSIYFTPTVQNTCHSFKPCKKFRNKVHAQGSGRLTGNRLMTYTGKIISARNCDTSFGAAGKCLTPYISVAADPRFYSMGDIIEMPSLKGRILTLPDGKEMIHPGYLIVQDVGGDIKGKNRFDFYTGTLDKGHADNAFGMLSSKDMVFTDTSQCEDRKKFTVVRRGSVAYESSLASIEDAIRDSANTSQVAIAARFPSSTTNGVAK